MDWITTVRFQTQTEVFLFSKPPDSGSHSASNLPRTGTFLEVKQPRRDVHSAFSYKCTLPHFFMAWRLKEHRKPPLTNKLLVSSLQAHIHIRQEDTSKLCVWGGGNAL